MAVKHNVLALLALLLLFAQAPAAGKMDFSAIDRSKATVASR